MAGAPTARNANVILGPGDVWINTAAPASGAVMTVTAAANGELTPDATENSSVIHIGYTQDGAVVNYKPEITKFTPDESRAPVISAIVGEPSSITGSWWQLLDMATVVKMMVGATAFAPTGWSGAKWGGKTAITTFPVVVIAPLQSDPTKVFQIMLYKAFNEAGMEFGVSQKSVAASPFEFVGQEVSTRTVGDRIGYFVRQT